MVRPLFFFILVCAGLPACMSAQVRSQAAYDFSCPENEVQATQTATGNFEARGCGRAAIYNQIARSPMARASYDLSCPAAKLAMTDLGDNSIGVEGCGKRATYAWVDSAWVGGPR
jgi:hypothetical protein